MTGSEYAIERVAQVLNDEGACCGDCGREPGDPLSECPDCERFVIGYARALAEAGLLALAPLREARYTLICEDGIAHGSYGTAEEAARHADHDAPVMVSYSTGWMRVDHAEGDGRAGRPSWVDEHGINHADGDGGRW